MGGVTLVLRGTATTVSVVSETVVAVRTTAEHTYDSAAVLPWAQRSRAVQGDRHSRGHKSNTSWYAELAAFQSEKVFFADVQKNSGT